MIGSYSKTVKDMTFSIYKWEDFSNSQHAATILDFNTMLTPIEQEIMHSTNGNNFSMVGFKIYLDRHSQKYFINYYLPSLIFVTVSWVSFLIPPDIVPGRMALLITLLLVLINMFGTIVVIQPPSQVSLWQTRNCSHLYTLPMILKLV